MTLALNTLRCPAGLSPQRREFARGVFSIGRGVECAWVLGDPERVLSKRHCSLAWQDGAWVAIDVSRNGTFLNDHPLDPGMPYPLRAGDRLSFGAYEFEIQLVDDAETVIGPPVRFPATGRLTSDPFTRGGEPLETVEASVGSTTGSDLFRNDPPGHDPLGHDPLGHDPLGDDPLWPESAPAGLPPVASGQASDLRDGFRLPRPSSELLPSDWYSQDGDRDTSDASPAGLSTPERPVPTPAAAPDVAAAPSVVEDGFGAFASGAGVAGTPHIDPQQALRELGGAFRAAVAGLRRVMIARAAIKSELRADQTIIRASGNNPIKFATDDDDALAALLGIGRRGGMPAERAMAEAIGDLRLHELAMAAAVPEAIRTLLGMLAPERLLRELPASAGDAIPGRRRQRAWGAFETLHTRMLQGMDDDFHNLVGRAFTQAYEAALADLGRRDDADDAPPAS